MTDAERNLLLLVARKIATYAFRPGGEMRMEMNIAIARVQYEADCRQPDSFDMSAVASVSHGDA